MESQQSFASRDDLWRLQSELKNVSVVQAEHADRLTRLERRQDDDGRTKSIWGGASPFPAPIGTPSADPSYNPAAEAFKNFDQDQSASMVGSLHLDTEEEPRRGTSRANSVRFDESALGQLGHSSRPSSDFFPMRSSSAFGSHPLVERSASHKSEGRQSSTHSARLNSIGSDGRASAANSTGPVGPPPGLSFLGPLPSIIRCWLDTNYSNDTLLYAGICTGSYKSTLSSRIVERIGQKDNVREQDGARRLLISVYLPEATISESSSRSASPAPPLPFVTVDFYVSDVPQIGASIDVLLGSDLLRLKNADILFSQDKLSMLDDDQNRLAIPLVRPENTEIFKYLVTSNSSVNGSHSAPSATDPPLRLDPADKLETLSSLSQPDSGTDFFPLSATSSKRPSVIGEGRRSMSTRDLDVLRTSSIDTDAGSNGASEATPRLDPTTIGSWRREAPTGKDGVSFSSVASNGTARGIRGKSMKVLRPSRSGTSRSISGIQSPSPLELGSSTPKWPPEGTTASSSGGEGDATTPLSATGSVKTRGSNPVGGASAFSWMNPAAGPRSG